MMDYIQRGDTAVAVAVVAIIAVYYYNRNRGLPPGPVSFPFFGYSLILKDRTCHNQLAELQGKYGDIFSFTHAGNLYINIGSMRAMQEFFSSNADFFERSTGYTILFTILNEGLFLANGERWRVLRKFFLQQLRECGMNAMSKSLPLHDSIQDTLKYMKSKKDEPFPIFELLSDKCSDILRRTMFVDVITEEQMKYINDCFYRNLRFTTTTNILYAGFFSRILLPLKPGFFAAIKNYKKIIRVLNGIVDDHKVKFDKNEQPDNFIDSFLKERCDRSARGDPTAKYFTDKSLVSSLSQIIGDSVLVVSLFMALFMIKIEEYQDEIYAEIDDVVGRDRLPTMEDKIKLPLTNACIYEVMRTSRPFSIVPSQRCIKETVIRGYRIPKGAITLMNMWAAHNDPMLYPEPEKFNPSRFMSEDKRSGFLGPFGVGRRSCLGESFVMAQTFLFLTSVIQNFRLSIAGDSVTDKYELLVTGKLNFRATPRN